MCANGACHFRVNQDSACGGYCCKWCHVAHAIQLCPPDHGQTCERLSAPSGAVRAQPRPPDGHLSTINQNFKKRRITPALELAASSTTGNILPKLRMSKSWPDPVFSLAAPREQGSQGQQCFTSTAPSGSESRLASAAAGSSAPTHLKNAPRGLLVPAKCGNEVQFGWGDVQMPCAVQWATGGAFYPHQRLPPVLRDSRFEKDRHRRIYICDGCNAHVAWCGQAKGFDGAYCSYDNKTQIQFLQRLWEQGKDFRWYCTMCYSKWWRTADLSIVRQQLGLTARTERRKARTEVWRQTTMRVLEREKKSDVVGAG